MIRTDQLDRLGGMDVIGSDGEKIGTVDEVYVDDATGDPSFALVNTGLFGMKSSFVPVSDASLDGEQLRVAHTKDKVKDAPNLDKDGHLDPSQEQELYRYYEMSDRHGGGLDTDPGGDENLRSGAGIGGVSSPGADAELRQGADAGRDADTGGRDVSGPGSDDAMTRSEEELHVGTRQRETGKVRLRKHVTTEHVTKTVPVHKEEIRVEREPITDGNAGDATDGPAISEEEHEVTLHEEEPVVEKRTVPKERVRLDKDVHTDEETVEDDVAKEEIDVTGLEDSRVDQDRR